MSQDFQFLICKSAEEDVSVSAFIQDETIWITANQMAILFDKSESTIRKHINNVFDEGELNRENNTQKVRVDGVKQPVAFYNLDVIISVGYRVNSRRATQFRIWATSVLKEYMLKGFAMDDERLKQGKTAFGKDYFRELLERVRSIRASERRIWQQITDIFAECSIDYDKDAQVTHDFYAMVQNKFHYAIVGQTAAEIVYTKADRAKENMGLTTWKNAPDGRILNSVKTFGNIVCFRDLEEATNDAIALFGDKDANGIVLLKSYEDYYYGCVDDKGREQKGYEERIAELLQKYPLGQPIIGEQNKKDFIVLFGNILRLRNILSAFDRFAGNEILSPIDFQDYTGTYHDVYDEIKPKPGSKDSIMDDVVFEMELVKQVEVNIDYILMLVAKYHDGNCEDKEILVAIDKAIKSSLQLRSKKELIENFIATINTSTDVDADWQRFVREQRETDIQTLITEEKLKPEETRKFVENAFRDGVLKTTGTDVDRLMPPVSRFGGGGSRDKKKQTVIEKLKAFFEKYFGLLSPTKTITGSKVVDYQYTTSQSSLGMVAEEPAPYGKTES